MTKNAMRRALLVLSLTVGVGVTGRAVVACNDNPLIPPPVCQPGQCTCDEDPAQSTCKGFNEREEGGRDPADATPVVPTEASTEDGGGDADADGDVDGGEDGS